MTGLAHIVHFLAPMFHRVLGKEVVQRKSINNKRIYIFSILLTPIHPHPPAHHLYACAREGWGERERSLFAAPDVRRRSRHVCAGWAISPLVEQGYGQAQVADVDARLAQLHKPNGSFLAAGAATAAGTVTV